MAPKVFARSRLDEKAALEVTAMRVIETAGREQPLWGEDDSAWASRAAAEVVGAGAAPEAFLRARARLVLERIGERSKAYTRAVKALQWRTSVGFAIVVLALIAGVAVDQVGGAQRINLLAPPLFALVVWNLAVYAALAAGHVARYGDSSSKGFLRDWVARFAGGRPRSPPGLPGATDAPGIADIAIAVPDTATHYWTPMPMAQDRIAD